MHSCRLTIRDASIRHLAPSLRRENCAPANLRSSLWSNAIRHPARRPDRFLPLPTASSFCFGLLHPAHGERWCQGAALYLADSRQSNGGERFVCCAQQLRRSENSIYSLLLTGKRDFCDRLPIFYNLNSIHALIRIDGLADAPGLSVTCGRAYDSHLHSTLPIICTIVVYL
jgi:hypothetical protein